MKRINLLLLGFLVILVVSCQKEIDWGTDAGGPGGGGGGTGNQLVKTVSKSGTDSVVTVYSYNSAGKIMNIKITGKQAGVDVGNEERIYRDAAGVVIRKTQINNMLVAAGIDSTVTTVYSSASPARYSAKVFKLSLLGLDMMDSTVLIYDAAGKVTEEHDYQALPLLGQPYELMLKIKYTYTGGLLTKMDQYDYDASTSTEDLAISTKYTFDARPAALQLDNDAYAISHPDLTSVNNAIKMDISSPSTPAVDRIFTLVYTYGPNNKPATAVHTETPAGTVSNIKFYYQ